MATFNAVHLMGNLTRDPELRYTPQGTAICEFGLAINRKWKSGTGELKEEVAFFDIVAWAKTAEICAEYLKKGRSVFVAGRLTQERWEDKNTQKKMSRVKIVAENVQFIGPKDQAAAGGRPAQGEQVPAGSEEDIPF